MCHVSCKTQDSEYSVPASHTVSTLCVHMTETGTQTQYRLGLASHRKPPVCVHRRECGTPGPDMEDRSGSREQQGKDKDVPEDRSSGREQCIGGGGRWDGREVCTGEYRVGYSHRGSNIHQVETHGNPLETGS